MTTNTNEIEAAVERVKAWLSGSEHVRWVPDREIRTIVKAFDQLSAASARGVADGWKPIETCDTWKHDHMHTMMAFWESIGRARETYWDEDEDFDERPNWWKSPREGWRSPGDQCIPVNQESVTHWMPLPASPATPSSPAATPEVGREDSEKAVRKLRSAIFGEMERWHIVSRDGRDDVCRNDDDYDEYQVMASFPFGDGAMHMYDMQADAVARVAFQAVRTPPAPAGEECDRCAGNGEIVTDWDSYVGDGKPATDAVETCPDCDGTGKVDAPDPFTTGFIAGRNAAAGVAANLVECDRDCGFRELADRGDMIVAAIRAIEAPRESGRAAATSYPHGAALTPDAQVIGAGDNVAPVAAGVERFCRQNGGNAGEGGNG